MLRASVQNAVIAFLTKFEGELAFMYLDQIGLVTTAIGCKVDPVEDALDVDWIIPGRGPATSDEVRASWEAVKAATNLELGGGGGFWNVPGNVVRLTQASLDALVDKRLASFVASLEKSFPTFDTFCADGQLVLVSMSWGMGGSFEAKFPKFTADVKAGNWLQAAIESHESNGAPARNAANASLCINAAVVAADNMNPDVLVFPAKLSPDAPDTA